MSSAVYSQIAQINLQQNILPVSFSETGVCMKLRFLYL